VTLGKKLIKNWEGKEGLLSSVPVVPVSLRGALQAERIWGWAEDHRASQSGNSVSVYERRCLGHRRYAIFINQTMLCA
jgi:hypothetical protein